MKVHFVLKERPLASNTACDVDFSFLGKGNYVRAEIEVDAVGQTLKKFHLGGEEEEVLSIEDLRVEFDFNGERVTLVGWAHDLAPTMIGTSSGIDYIESIEPNRLSFIFELESKVIFRIDTDA